MALQSMDPSATEALFTQACAALQAGQWAHAEALFRKLLALQPKHLGALNLLGILLTQTGRFEEAAGAMRAALDINARSEATFCNYGLVLKKLGRLSDALSAFDQALALNAAAPDTWNSRGTVLSELQRFDDAVHDFSRAIGLNPNFADAYYNQGNALYRSGRCEPAIACYEKAVALAPTNISALNNCGNAYNDLKQFTRAIACYDRALAIGPDVKNTRGMRLFAKMHLCDWSDYEAERTRILSRLSEGHPATVPLALLPLSSTASDQLTCAQLFAADQMIGPAPQWHGTRRRHERIRVGYASSDFREHPVASLTAGMFERHDRSRFETIGISFGAEDNSAMRARLRAGFERFVNVAAASDQDIAQFIRAQEIDILVDLNGYTSGARSRIFAQRPAPIQVNYLGYPGTMGVDCIDYIIVDRVVIPEDQQRFYSEKVVYLPDAYQANDDRRRISEETPTRAEVGLPEIGFVFCSFNNSFKITPLVFDRWMNLLRAVEGSVLWLLEGNPWVPANLRREAEQRGVSGDRLVFAPRTKLEDHLARHRLADLFLDTLPYNAHTTASDALWAGLPVVTSLGSTFAARVAASLVTAAGLPELVTRSLDDYEALALKLARDHDLLAGIKARLADQRLRCPLFDTERFTRHIEAALTTIWERHQRGEAPQSFAVAE
jgi:protein O-GlcNAc transferase